MALFPCPSCQQQVSTEALACPHCGHQFKKAAVVSGINPKDPVHFIGLVLAGLMIIGIIAAIVVMAL